MEYKNYTENGVIYNLENIWNYVENIEYWDCDDFKFDFWFRLNKHQRIFYEVMKLNGKLINNHNYEDSTQKLLNELIEKNKDNHIEIIWDD